MVADSEAVIEVTSLGTDGLLLTARGPWSDVVVTRCAALLRAAVHAGVTLLICDLTAAGEVPARLRDALSDTQAELAARSGLMLVDGVPPQLDALDPHVAVPARRLTSVPPLLAHENGDDGRGPAT